MISFLRYLTPRKSLDDAFPEDIRKFLAYKDKSGKTQVQVNECPFRRAAGSVDSLIGQIRANVFSEIIDELMYFQRSSTRHRLEQNSRNR